MIVTLDALTAEVYAEVDQLREEQRNAWKKHEQPRPEWRASHQTGIVAVEVRCKTI